MLEVQRAAMTLRTSAEEARRIGGEVIPLDWTRDAEGRFGITRRFPAGPVLGITPFNFPLNLACHKLGPAVAAGNPLILKPASATPVSALLLADMALGAGIPPEALSVVPCPRDIAERLVEDQRIAVLSFTGSPGAGWHLKEKAARKKVTLGARRERSSHPSQRRSTWLCSLADCYGGIYQRRAGLHIGAAGLPAC